MEIKNLHNWNLSYSAAVALQKQLAGELSLSPFTKKLRIVAGCDCAFTKDKKNVIAAIVALRTDTFEVIETAYAVKPATFPYIPGLLSFREAPACLSAAAKLKAACDCIIVDGQGIAHPRRLGLAAHLGLFWGVPTIGCAKSRLTGSFTQPAREKGSYSPLEDKGQIIGAVVRTRSNVKPVFVSPGNRCRIADAIRIVLHCCTKYRLPEPTRIAHQMVSRQKTNYT